MQTENISYFSDPWAQAKGKDLCTLALIVLVAGISQSSRPLTDINMSPSILIEA